MTLIWSVIEELMDMHRCFLLFGRYISAVVAASLYRCNICYDLKWDRKYSYIQMRRRRNIIYWPNFNVKKWRMAVKIISPIFHTTIHEYECCLNLKFGIIYRLYEPFSSKKKVFNASTFPHFAFLFFLPDEKAET